MGRKIQLRPIASQPINSQSPIAQPGDNVDKGELLENYIEKEREEKPGRNLRPGRAINTEKVPNQIEMKDMTNRIRERERERKEEAGETAKSFKKNERVRQKESGGRREGEKGEEIGIECTEKWGGGLCCLEELSGT
eukprot:sb/3474542/